MREPAVDNQNILSMNAKGYYLEIVFALHFYEGLPNDFKVDKPETGWNIRRAMIKWCEKHEITDYIIYKNRSYVKDTHGKYVYELYVKQQKSVDKNLCWYCDKPLDVCDGSCGRTYYEQLR